MFGGRYPDEEGIFIHKSWFSWISKNKNPVPEFRNDGILVLAPKQDNISLLSDRRMLIPIDPVTFQPLDETERQLGHPAVPQPGAEDLYTTVVYIPPFFKTRISVFLFLIWLSGSLLVCSFSVIPRKLIIIIIIIMPMYIAVCSHSLFSISNNRSVIRTEYI
jgi:E3 ubiquitin-protein ligase DOA10